MWNLRTAGHTVKMEPISMTSKTNPYTFYQHINKRSNSKTRYRSSRKRIFEYLTSTAAKRAGGNYGHLLTKMSKPPAKWIPDSSWKEVLQLASQIEAFSGVTSNIAVNQRFWRKFSTCSDPYGLLESAEEFEQQDSTGKKTFKLSWMDAGHGR